LNDGVFKWLQEDIKPRVDSYIRQELGDSSYCSQLWYPFSTGGKRWRPGLTYLVSQICDLDGNITLRTASAIEVLHNFTLVHDDVMDGDGYRRNEPSVWNKYGENKAINIGDMLFTESIKMFPPELRYLAMQTAMKIFEGQQMDLDFEDRRDVGEEEYLEMVQKKTGALLDLCLEAPQKVSGTNLDVGDYSLLGPAFQIRDDLLDFEEGKGREKIGNDVREGKRTLMVVHANNERLYDILDKPFDETTEEDIERAKEILETEGSFGYARQKMEQMANKAISSLDDLPSCREKDKLREFGLFLVRRDK